jgi:prepilin-type N-terminal cleavage/methylation domain-containing protein
MKTVTTARAGFTLVEIMIVVAIIGLLAAIAVPNYVHARKSSQTNACINNLRQLDGAKQQWALESGKKSSETPTSAEIQPYIGRGQSGSLAKLYCPLVVPAGPMDGYTINAVGTAPVCKQFDSVDHPARMN